MDILRCKGIDCKLRKSCYRFVVFPRNHFCDFDKKYAEELKKDKQYICEHYWKV